MPEFPLQPTDEDNTQKEILKSLVAIYASLSGIPLELSFTEFKRVDPDGVNLLTEPHVKVTVNIVNTNTSNPIAGSPYTVQVPWSGSLKIGLYEALHQGFRNILP